MNPYLLPPNVIFNVQANSQSCCPVGYRTEASFQGTTPIRLQDEPRAVCLALLGVHWCSVRASQPRTCLGVEDAFEPSREATVLTRQTAGGDKQAPKGGRGSVNSSNGHLAGKPYILSLAGWAEERGCG